MAKAARTSHGEGLFLTKVAGKFRDEESARERLESLKMSECVLSVCRLHHDPFSIVECKRVGV